MLLLRFLLYTLPCKIFNVFLLPRQISRVINLASLIISGPQTKLGRPMLASVRNKGQTKKQRGYLSELVAAVKGPTYHYFWPWKIECLLQAASYFTHVELRGNVGKFSFHRERGQNFEGKRRIVSEPTGLTCVAATLKYGGFPCRIR